MAKFRGQGINFICQPFFLCVPIFSSFFDKRREQKSPWEDGQWRPAVWHNATIGIFRMGSARFSIKRKIMFFLSHLVSVSVWVRTLSENRVANKSYSRPVPAGFAIFLLFLFDDFLPYFMVILFWKSLIITCVCSAKAVTLASYDCLPLFFPTDIYCVCASVKGKERKRRIHPFLFSLVLLITDAGTQQHRRRDTVVSHCLNPDDGRDDSAAATRSGFYSTGRPWASARTNFTPAPPAPSVQHSHGSPAFIWPSGPTSTQPSSTVQIYINSSLLLKAISLCSLSCVASNKSRKRGKKDKWLFLL